LSIERLTELVDVLEQGFEGRNWALQLLVYQCTRGAGKLPSSLNPYDDICRSMSHVIKDTVGPASADLRFHKTADFAKRTTAMLGTALGLNPTVNMVEDRLSQRSLLSRCCDDRIGAQIPRMPAMSVLRSAQQADQTRLSAPYRLCGRSPSLTTLRWGRIGVSENITE